LLNLQTAYAPNLNAFKKSQVKTETTEWASSYTSPLAPIPFWWGWPTGKSDLHNTTRTRFDKNESTHLDV